MLKNKKELRLKPKKTGKNELRLTNCEFKVSLNCKSKIVN